MTRDHIIIHCSASPPTHDWGAVEIDRMHRQQGWLMCGYHEIIRRNGAVENAEGGFPTRPLDKAGAHVGDCGPGWNARALGICLIGGVDKHNVPEANYTAAQWATLVARIRHYLTLYPGATVMGHRDLIKLTKAPAKACPCFDVIPWWSSERDTQGKYLLPAPTVQFPRPGRKPDKLTVRTHKVREGDTLWSLSRTYGQTVERLRDLNDLEGNTILVGQELRLT